MPLDVTPHWFGLALDHLGSAEAEHRKLTAVWQRQENEEYHES
jgi:hypothetical protein